MSEQNKARIRVIDLESTHPTPAEGGLVEIGYADLEAQSVDLAGLPTDWKVIGGRGRLCNPGCPVPPETEAIHHLGDDDVRHQPDWKVLFFGLLRKAVDDHVIAYAAYGADFELQFMHPDWMGPTPPPMVDVHKVGLRVWEDKPPHHSNRALQYWRKPIGLNKADALPNHRAYPDALVTAFLLRDLLNDEGCALEQMIEWSKLPALTVRCYIGDWRNDGRGTLWKDVDTSFLEWILYKGFHDKPDVRFTAEYHLAKRRAEEDQERERDELNAQFRANGMSEIKSFSSPDIAAVPVADTNQESLPL